MVVDFCKDYAVLVCMQYYRSLWRKFQTRGKSKYIKINICRYVNLTTFNRIRGTLGSMLMLSSNVGILASFVLGHYVDYIIIPLVLMSVSVAFMLAMVFQHETPPYLLRAGLQIVQSHIKYQQHAYLYIISNRNRKDLCVTIAILTKSPRKHRKVYNARWKYLKLVVCQRQK